MITRLEVLRRKKFGTQVELASKLGISQGEVSLLERGHTKPREDVKNKLEEIFELPFDQLAQDISDQVIPTDEATDAAVTQQ